MVGSTVALLAAAGFALMSGSAIVLAAARLSRPAPGAPRAAFAEAGTAFLFEGGNLVDATPAARRLLGAIEGPPGLAGPGRAAFAGLLAHLGPRFGPDLPARLAALAPTGRLRLAAVHPDEGRSGGPAVLEAEAEDGALRLTLHGDEGGDGAADRLRLLAAEREVETLRAVAEDAPGPIWALGPTGSLLWANRAYLALADAAWPPSERGAGEDWPALPLLDAAPPGERRRVALHLPGAPEPRRFDVSTVRRGEGTVSFAADMGPLAAADARGEALARTFDALPTGVAVFDGERRLAHHNAAWARLTGLDGAFLGARPPLHGVLDRLRQARIMPEGRGKAWRDEVAALEDAAARGAYCEAWTLPGGEVYRVTGRPHPGGALALLVEDVSDEVALTRRFRQELDAARAVLDALPEAVAAFSADGTLSLSNAAYAALWGGPAGAGGVGGGLGGDPTLGGEVARWEAACAPSDLWARLREGGRPAGSGGGGREAALRLRDGRALGCRVVPLAGGATLVAFRLVPA